MPRETKEYEFLAAKVAEAKAMPQQSTGNFVFGRNEFGTLYFSGGEVTLKTCAGGGVDSLMYGIYIDRAKRTVIEIIVPSHSPWRPNQVIPPEAIINRYENISATEVDEFLATLTHYQENHAVADLIRWG